MHNTTEDKQEQLLLLNCFYSSTCLKLHIRIFHYPQHCHPKLIKIKIFQNTTETNYFKWRSRVDKNTNLIKGLMFHCLKRLPQLSKHLPLLLYLQIAHDLVDNKLVVQKYFQLISVQLLQLVLMLVTMPMINRFLVYVVELVQLPGMDSCLGSEKKIIIFQLFLCFYRCAINISITCSPFMVS